MVKQKTEIRKFLPFLAQEPLLRMSMLQMNASKQPRERQQNGG